MKRSSLGLLVVLLGWIRISDAATMPGSSSSATIQSRNYDNYNNPTLSAAVVNNQVLFPFQSSSAGISRTYYPYYVGYPNYPTPAVGYAVPSGASALSGRSYSGYGNQNVYSSYPSLATSNTASANTPLLSYASPSYSPTLRSNVPYGYTNNYYTNPSSYGGNVNTFDNSASYRSIDPADPADPDDPTDSGSGKKTVLQLPMAPRFSFPTSQGYTAPQTSGYGSGQAAAGSASGSDFLSSIAARSGAIGGSSLGYGGNSYASAVPEGATYSGPSSGYAQSSPNVATGSVYNPGYGKTYPSYYGASPPASGGGAYPAASLYPYYLYYPVEYGYDQGERSVMPTGSGYFPLIGYKRRYGYRHGPYYGYGVYVDYPPYFGFGKVKDGWGSDPEADAMASVALAQGSGASETYGSQAQSQSSSNYGNDGSYGVAPGSTTGYGNGNAAYSSGTGSNYNGAGSLANYAAGSPSAYSPSSSGQGSYPVQSQYGQQSSAGAAVSSQYGSGSGSSSSGSYQ